VSVVKYARNARVEVEARMRDENGAFVTTSLMQTTVQRTSDFNYWDGDSFETAPTQLSMTKISDANSPGLWQFLFPTTGFNADTYLFDITDASVAKDAVNVPLQHVAIVGDMLAMFQEWAAAGAIGKAVYNSTTSVLTLTFVNGTDTLSFDMKDSVGNPAASSPFFEKIPQ